MCIRDRHLVAPEGEIGIRLAAGTAHAPAYLVKLGKAHVVGILNNKGVAVAHVHAGLDKCGAHKKDVYKRQQYGILNNKWGALLCQKE